MKTSWLLIFALFSTLLSHSQRITKEERQLIKSGLKTEAMRLFRITDSADLVILRNSSADVPNPNYKIWEKLCLRMLVTVKHASNLGVGIAAPQVGINRNIILVQRFDKEEKPFEIYFNPKIIVKSDSLCPKVEGCLSIPIIKKTVIRPWAIKIQYQISDGTIIEEEIEGFTARIFQHEIDHLNGVLYTDHVESAHQQ